MRGESSERLNDPDGHPADNDEARALDLANAISVLSEMRRWPAPLMSNFDQEVDTTVEAKLREGGWYAEYAAWNFHADCVFIDGRFHAYVMRYHEYQGVVSGDTPEEVMQKCSDRWGPE